jgi:hypothetical protein
MPAFKKYPTEADGVSRKQRKSQRKNIFAFNSMAFAEQRRVRVKARKDAEKAATEKENA